MHPRKRQRKNASSMKLVGKLVARFRHEAGMTQGQLATAAGVQEDTISSIEQGRRSLVPDLADAMDDLLDTKGALSTAVDNMPEVDLIPLWAEDYIDMEQEALALSWFDNQVIPGLLQTKAYAEAVFRNRIPVYSPEEIETHTATRLQRQHILHRKKPPTTSIVIWEPVLMMRLTSEEEHRKQLRHLYEMAQLPGVCLQVLPLESLSHAGLNGPFILLETPDHQRVAYTETQRGSQLITDPNEVSILTQKYAMLRAQALTPEKTLRLLARLLGENTMSTGLNWFKSSYSGDEGGACLEVAYDWRKSSYSGSDGGQCLEVAYNWKKSSHSGDEGGQCVEVAAHPAAVHIRDSKDVEGPTFSVAPSAWSAFAAYAATA
ncbi:Scr1 family TA system antitoxin-like transcriptional regulator [Streptomyces californicus]|nr:Scr1 family TA system antitoxin-like transcriptional regulator [Streptomyces californicus]